MKIFKTIINIILTLFIIVGLSVLILYIVGIKPYVVISGSMESNIKIGSISFINTRYPFEKINVGDIIAFKRDTIFATHRVVEKQYVGKNILSIPKTGYIIQATQTKAGKVILITTIVFILACAFFVIKPEEKTQE